jgi:hypothetical protein
VTKIMQDKNITTESVAELRKEMEAE